MIKFETNKKFQTLNNKQSNFWNIDFYNLEFVSITSKRSKIVGNRLLRPG